MAIAASQMVGEKSAAIIEKMTEQPLKKKAQFNTLPSFLRKEFRAFTGYSRGLCEPSVSCSGYRAA